MSDQRLVLAEPLFQDAPFGTRRPCGRKVFTGLLSLLICLGFAVFFCSWPCTHGGVGPITNIAWESMQPAKAWHFQQSARVTQSIFRQSWPSERHFVNSFPGVPSLPSRTEDRLWRPRQPSEKQVTHSVRGVPSPQSSNKDREDWVTQGQIGKEHGVITNWYFDKGFGWIKPTDGSYKKVFCHASALADDAMLNGRVILNKGDQVTYGTVFDEDQGAWKCVDVSRARGSERLAAKRETGEVKTWDSDKGFGFIQPSDGSRDVFCHYRDIADGEGSLRRGDQVTFEKQFNHKSGRYRCVDVSLASDQMHA